MVFSSTSITTFGKQFTLNKSVYSNNFIIFMNPQLNLHKNVMVAVAMETHSASVGPHIAPAAAKPDIFGKCVPNMIYLVSSAMCLVQGIGASIMLIT